MYRTIDMRAGLTQISRRSLKYTLWFKQIGAGDGIRTRNPQLGKLMRYRCATPAQEGEKKIVKDLIRVNPRPQSALSALR